jgi:hypothetical protein
MKKKKNLFTSSLTTGGLEAIIIPGSALALHDSKVQDSTDVRPFQFHASDEALADLHRRMQQRGFPAPHQISNSLFLCRHVSSN